MGHLNYAEATRSRLHRENPDDPAVRRRLVRRMVEQYEAALEAYAKRPDPKLAMAVARAHLGLAREALGARAEDRALRFLDACLALEGLTPEVEDEARALRLHVAQGRGRFDDAQKVLFPYLRLQDRAPKAIASGDDRKRIADAIESLRALVADAPEYWQAAWLLGKANEAVGDVEGALDVLRAAHARHPSVDPLARDLSLLLLGRDEIAEALEVNRTVCEHRPNAENLCNLAVSLLLSGNLEIARTTLERSLALNPADPVAKAVKGRLARYLAGAPPPRTLRDLERGPG